MFDYFTSFDEIPQINSITICPKDKLYSVILDEIKYVGGICERFELPFPIKYYKKGNGSPIEQNTFDSICGTSKEMVIKLDLDKLSSLETINVKSLDDTILRLHVDLDTFTVLNAKELIWKILGTPIHTQKLYIDKTMHDEKLLSHYGIIYGITIDLIPKLNQMFIPFNLIDATGEHNQFQSRLYSTLDWKICKKGLCVEGLCPNPRCRAYNKTVVINKHFEPFDLEHEKNSTKNMCPICNNFVTATSLFLNSCLYTITTKKKNVEEKTGGITKVGYLIPNMLKRSDTNYDKFTVHLNEIGCSKSTQYICPICVKPVSHIASKEPVSNCAHKFHQKCLNEWGKRSSNVNCPMHNIKCILCNNN